MPTTTPRISREPAAPGQRVLTRDWVSRDFRVLRNRVGTVTAVDGRWIEVAWDGLHRRLGFRPSHLMLAANDRHRPARTRKDPADC